MKHAYLIIAHQEPQILAILLSMLDDKRNDIYLHIDKRSEKLYQEMSSFQMKEGRLFLIDNRMEVYWGDISQVEVEYLMFETAFNQETYLYYHLLSGVDLPIKSQDQIHSFFEQNAGKEFIDFWTDAKHEKDLNRKINRYYLFTKQLKNKKEFSHHITAPIRNLVLGIQKAINYKRKHSFDIFRKGSNWVSITHGFCNYLIQQKPIVLKEFRKTLCPDEIFLQTILWNSPYREHLHKQTIRRIDWQRGSPYTWTSKDYSELMSSPQLFARKFSSADLQIVKKLFQTFKGEKSGV